MSKKGPVASGDGGGAPPPAGERGGAYEMDESDGGGYRGWGSTAGRKTPMTSSVGTGYPKSTMGKSVSEAGYSNNTSISPGYGNGGDMYNAAPISPISPIFSDSTASTAAPLLGAPAPSPAFTESSIIGAMPTFESNAGGGLNRGISNASSNYSEMSQSDQSEYDQRQSHYYGPDAQEYDASYFSNRPKMYYDESSNPPPVIREVQARRNTRIETPTSAHFPQQGSSGIAQNF